MSDRDDLREAYRSTSYHVETRDRELVLRIGERNEALEAFLRDAGASSGTCITAWNPGSRAMSEEENRLANADLAKVLAAVGLATLPQRGVGLDPSWVPEEGFFRWEVSWH